MRLRLCTILLALFAVFLSACGSNKGQETTTTTAAAKSDAADVVIAKQLVVTSTELPAPWTGSPTDTGDNNIASGIYNQLGSCVGVPNAASLRTATYAGETFSNKSNGISSGVSAFKSADVVTTEVAGINNSASYDCVKAFIQNIVQSAGNVTGGAAPDTQLGSVPGLALGDNEFGLRAVTHLKTETIDQSIYTDLIGVGRGRFITTVALNYFGDAPPADLEQKLLNAVAAKASSTKGTSAAQG